MADYDGTTILKYGSQGDDVVCLQQQLESLSFNPGNLNGDFNYETQDAVQAFQAYYSLPITGEVDQDVWTAMLGAGAWIEAEPLVDSIGEMFGFGGDDEGPTAERFVQLCLGQVNDDYKGKGGHWRADREDDDPDAFDCSGLILWACYQLGVNLGDTTAKGIIDKCDPLSVSEAYNLRGAVFFGPPKPGSNVSGHIGVSLGDGEYMVDASGSLERVTVRRILKKYFTDGGLIPGIIYPT